MTNYKPDDPCRNCHPCHPPRPRPTLNQTILSCGTGSGLVIPDHNENHSQLFNPYVIASVALDASELKQANVKVDFSAIILFKDNDSDDLRLTFQLSKTYVNGGKIPLGTWTYERHTSDGSCFEYVDSFGFTWCECSACPGCAYYTVELINVESEDVDCRAITSPSINALAVGPLAYYGEY